MRGVRVIVAVHAAIEGNVALLCMLRACRTASRRFRSSRVHRLIQPSLSYNSLQRTRIIADDSAAAAAAAYSPPSACR